MSYELATAKQKSYYKTLTGRWLPKGCSKSNASKMIEKALKGEDKKKPDLITVCARALDYGFNGESYAPTLHRKVFYTVEKNYYPVYEAGMTGHFESAEAAMAFAKSRFPDATIEDRTSSVRYLCVD